jgi:putative hydrolase of the HAD superfamily
MMRGMAALDQSEDALVVLPPRSVLDAFGVGDAADEGDVRPLAGGQGFSVRVGGLVFRPCDAGAIEEAQWAAEAVAGLADHLDTAENAGASGAAGFRVARPVRAASGEFFVNGWGATKVLSGQLRGIGSDAADWEGLFAAARAYGSALRSLPKPDFLDRRDHRWALADRVAFGTADYADPVAGAGLLLDALLRRRRPLADDEPSQVMHGDLAGNVLFAPDRVPAVIDLSPYWRPVGFSLAVVAIDALLWYDAPLTVLELAAAGTGPGFADHLIRALIFRLVAFSESAKQGGLSAAEIGSELDRYDLVYDAVKRFQAGPLGSRTTREFDAVLCDIDGVLRHWPSDDALEQAHGLAPGAFAATAYVPQRLLPAITGEVSDEQWRASVAVGLVDEGHCATPAAAGAVVAQWNLTRPRVDEDVLALLQLARGVMPVALVSNATSRLEADLADLGLAEFADDVVNTSRIGCAKPDPRVFEHAARHVGVPVERCLFVDDTWEHVESARGLGMRALHFREAADLEEALRPLFPLLSGRA